MKLGYIDYLNCYPFYYHMFEKEPLKGVATFPDYPSSLNSMMLKAELDMSPVSSGAYPDLACRVVLIPDFCLSSVGYVGSVNLISRIPIEELDKKRVGITSASQTSVVLLKILLEKFYGIVPEYVPASPLPEMDGLDAALLIGNEAMMRPESKPVSFTYDLGELWLRRTGYPVVFAVFAVQKKALESYKTQIYNVIQSYRNSLDCLGTEKDIVVKKAKERYPDIPYDIDFYYGLFRFDFTDNLKAALEYYFGLAADMGLLKRIEKTEWLDL